LTAQRSLPKDPRPIWNGHQTAIGYYLESEALKYAAALGRATGFTAEWGRLPQFRLKSWGGRPQVVEKKVSASIFEDDGVFLGFLVGFEFK
jgi:hypothetical protein